MIESIFKVGHKVWTPAHGWGEVTRLELVDPEYPLTVDFGGNSYYFSSDGRYEDGDLNPTLFFREIEIPADAFTPPVEEIILNKGDVLLLKSGTFAYVESYSGPRSKDYTYRYAVPQNLDEAFDTVCGGKDFIKKVIGNINA